MTKLRLALAFATVFAVVLAASPVALAQVPLWDFSISAFDGAGIPFKTDVVLTDPTSVTTAEDVELETSRSFGGKIGAWWTGARPNSGLDFGIELDVTQFYPDLEPQTVNGTNSVVGPVFVTFDEKVDISATIVAANVMLRRPIGVTPALPYGQWHPYVGVGGGIEWATAETAGVEDTDTAGVVQALAGLKFFFTRNIALFGEYKWTRAEHTFNLAGVTTEVTGSVNHLVAGLAVHF